MNNKKERLNLAGTVLEKLKKEKIKTKPKIFFVLKTSLFVLGTFIVGLFALYLISLTVFVLRISGAWHLPKFGFHGLFPFVMSLPWILVLMAVALIVILEVLVKHFSFAYRSPVLYSIFGIIVFVTLGSFIVDKTQLHPIFFQRAEQGRLPLAGSLYRDFNKDNIDNMMVDNVYRGAVVKKIDQGFFLKTVGGDILCVIVSENTKTPHKDNIEIGDSVIVLGEKKEGQIQAMGVRKIDDNMRHDSVERPQRRLK